MSNQNICFNEEIRKKNIYNFGKVIFQPKILIYFLSFPKYICCGFSLEVP